MEYVLGKKSQNANSTILPRDIKTSALQIATEYTGAITQWRNPLSFLLCRNNPQMKKIIWF